MVVTRARSNRVFYQSPKFQSTTSKGHPKVYGEKFELKDETTRHGVDEVVQTKFPTKRDLLLNVKIQGWSNMLMRGSHNCPINSLTFTLMQIQVTIPEGIRIWKPMWLIMIGQRRNELTISEAYQSYRQRYDVEHLLRFGKQRLLLNFSATPSIEHEENSILLCFLAYIQLWVAMSLHRIWERYLSQKTEGYLTLSLVQRDIDRIISEIGTPANYPIFLTIKLIIKDKFAISHCEQFCYLSKVQ